MQRNDMRKLSRGAAARLSFETYLRTGRFDASLLQEAEDADETELKFNPNHDPANGRFTFGQGGNAERAKPAAFNHGTGRIAKPSYYQGMTVDGAGTISPVSGGYVDASGRYVPEIFPPDPYALTNPAAALQHYIDGSGEPMNYYLNAVDTSQVRLSDFPSVQQILDHGQPGTYDVQAANVKSFDSAAPFSFDKLSAGATVGRLNLQASGSLIIGDNGRYSFNGLLGVGNETYRFYRSTSRSWSAEASTMIGRALSGTSFPVYVIGTKPFTETGYVRRKR